MSISSSEAMALDRGGDLLDAIMYGIRDRRWISAAIKDEFPLDQMDGHGRDALAWAAKKGYAPEMEAMIARGVRVDVPDEDGRTPLMHAVAGGYAEAARLLTAANVNVNAEDKAGKTAIILAAASGFAEVITELAAAGGNVNVRDKETGKTPLMLAAAGGHIGAVRELAAAGAALNAVHEEQGTAAQMALDCGHKDITLYLISVGAKAPPLDFNTETQEATPVFSRPFRMVRKPLGV